MSETLDEQARQMEIDHEIKWIKSWISCLSAEITRLQAMVDKAKWKREWIMKLDQRDMDNGDGS